MKDDNAPVNTHPLHRRARSVGDPREPSGTSDHNNIFDAAMATQHHSVVFLLFGGTIWYIMVAEVEWQSQTPATVAQGHMHRRGGGVRVERVFQTPDQFGHGRPTAKGERKEEKEAELNVKGDEFKELVKDQIAGLPILGQVLHSTWWDWSRGSSPFFWRWNGNEQIQASMDGIVNFVQGPLPKRKPMKPLRLPAPQLKLVGEKIDSMIQRSYLSGGYVKSNLHFFAVPKG